MKLAKDWIAQNDCIESYITVQDIQTDARADLLERIKALEAELADCNRMLDETRAKLPTMAQVMVYGSLLRKFKASQAELADCQKRLEEARVLLKHVYDFNYAHKTNVVSDKIHAFLATFKEGK